MPAPTPVVASVSAPVLLKVASLDIVTPVATLDPLPTNNFPLVSVNVGAFVQLSVPLPFVESTPPLLPSAAGKVYVVDPAAAAGANPT